MTTLKDIKNRYIDKPVEQVGSKQLFKVFIGNNLIIYLSYNTEIAYYYIRDNCLQINPTIFSRTTQKHKGIIKRLHPTAIIKEMPL
jgi:hypothetical protein